MTYQSSIKELTTKIWQYCLTPLIIKMHNYPSTKPSAPPIVCLLGEKKAWRFSEQKLLIDKKNYLSSFRLLWELLILDAKILLNVFFQIVFISLLPLLAKNTIFDFLQMSNIWAVNFRKISNILSLIFYRCQIFSAVNICENSTCWTHSTKIFATHNQFITPWAILLASATRSDSSKTSSSSTGYSGSFFSETSKILWDRNIYFDTFEDTSTEFMPTNELLNLQKPLQFVLIHKGDCNPRSTSPSSSSHAMYIILWPTCS